MPGRSASLLEINFRPARLKTDFRSFNRVLCWHSNRNARISPTNYLQGLHIEPGHCFESSAFKLKKLSLNTEDKLKEIVSSEDKKLKASEDGANIPTSSKWKISERRKTVTKRKRKSKATENDGEPSAEINQKKSSNSKAERTCIWSLPHECSDNDVCFICNEPCSDKPEIIDHLNKKHRSTNDRLICPSKGCFSAFRYADSFFYHLISHFPCCGTKKLAERWK